MSTIYLNLPNVKIGDNIVQQEDLGQQPTDDNVIRLNRAANPIVEFDTNAVKKIFLNTFANLFFLGEGLEKTKGDINRRTKLHFSRYHDNRFATNPQFNFLIVDMSPRHQVAKNGHAKLMPSAATMQLINDNFLNDTIVPRLVQAQANPESPDAKELIRILKQVIKVTSSTIDWTPPARTSVLQLIYSHIFRFGTPNLFLTVSPDDTYNLDNVRRALVDKKVSNDVNGF